MKKILFSALLMLFTIKSSCQDTVKVQQIDSLVSVINQSNLIIQNDSILQDRPELGVTMKTYLTIALDGNKLKKYINKVSSVRLEKGISKQMIASDTFYFDEDKLIKVEELVIEGDKKQYFNWYYFENKPLYYTYQSEKSASRATLLLAMGSGILKQMQQ